MTKKEERLEILNKYAREYKVSTHEAVYDMLVDHYEAAGFELEPLIAELSPMTEKELVDLFCNV